MAGREEIVVALVASRGDRPEVFEFVEKALDSIALTVNSLAERTAFGPIERSTNIDPGAAPDHHRAQGITIISAVGERDVDTKPEVEKASLGELCG